jgi:hypothetical protein
MASRVCHQLTQTTAVAKFIALKKFREVLSYRLAVALYDVANAYLLKMIDLFFDKGRGWAAVASTSPNSGLAH